LFVGGFVKSQSINQTVGSSKKTRQPEAFSSQESRSYQVDISLAEGFAPTILIAEDDDDTRSMMRRLLELKGYRILEAKDGNQVAGIVLREEVGLILLDLGLPKLNGLRS